MATLKFDRALVKAMLDTVLSDDADVMLVKDDGIYLMSFGDKPKNAGSEWRRVVAYARGFDPKKDGEDVWEEARAAVGGDDFGEKVGTKKEFVAMLEDSVGDLAVKVTATTLSVAYIPKAPSAPKPVQPLDVFKGAKSGMWRVVHSVAPDGKPILYMGAFEKKSEATAFVKTLKSEPEFKARQDGLVLAHRAKAGVN